MDQARTISASPKTNPAMLPYGLLLFAAVAWGGSFVAARMVLNAPEGRISLSPTMLATVRFSLASLFFVPVLVRQHLRKGRLTPKDIPLFVLLGQLSISVYFFLQYTGVRLTSAGVSSVIVVGGIPLATMLVSAVMLRERLGIKKSAAIGLGAVGVALITLQKGISLSGSSFLVGALCLIADTLCFAVYSSLVRSIRSRYSPVTITAMTTLSGALGLLVVAAFTEDWSTLGRLEPGQWMAITYLWLVCSVMAYLAYNAALARIEASQAATWIYLESPVAIVLGVTLLRETVSPMTVVGSLLVLLSLFLTQRAMVQ